MPALHPNGGKICAKLKERQSYAANYKVMGEDVTQWIGAMAKEFKKEELGLFMTPVLTH